ncbi:MAG TPA: DUF4192 domain-containing protein [Cellulomonadaceae bacterium]|nr:DUF4192 domain-containing protein [Cellulomonadaceae bacterium]
MPTTTIRVREPRELIALIPHQLGFQPDESAVVVSLREPRGRVGLVARVDLDDLSDASSGPQLARTLVTHLVHDGAARAVLVLYTADDGAVATRAAPLVGETAGQPHTWRSPRVRTAARHLADAAEPYLGEVDTWVVGPRGYGGLDCTSPDCCPPGGRPLTELESTTTGAHMVLAGSVVAARREDLARIPRAGVDARRRAAAARVRAERRRSVAVAAGSAAVCRWRDEAIALWRAEVAAGRDGHSGERPSRLGRIEAALGDIRVRDAILVSFVPGTGDLAERTVGTGAGIEHEVSCAVARIVAPSDGLAPPLESTVSHRAALEAVVAHGRLDAQAPALSLLAVLAWWSADGARAAVLLDRALEADPGYRLALLVREAVDAGMPPGWVRRDG